MPDCLEMPYKPAIVGAHEPAEGEKRWRMGGTSCLAGDYCGDWAFRPRTESRRAHCLRRYDPLYDGQDHVVQRRGAPLDRHCRRDGRTDVIREFGYEDFRNRMS